MAPRSTWLFTALLIAACGGRSTPDRGASNSGSDGTHPGGRLKVLLVSAPETAKPYLEMALLAGELDVEKLSPQEFDAQVAKRSLPAYSVIVLDDHTPAALPPPPVRLLYFHPTGEHSPFRVQGELAGAKVTRVRENHQVVRGVAFAEAQFEATSVLAVNAKRGDVVLAAAGADPVIAAASSPSGKTIACGFRTSDTAWVLQATFAVFVHNAVDWLVAAPR